MSSKDREKYRQKTKRNKERGRAEGGGGGAVWYCEIELSKIARNNITILAQAFKLHFMRRAIKLKLQKFTYCGV